MDFGSALGAGISGGFGLLGSGLNYYFNKKLADQQNQYNIDMWKMQNEYNSPQAQMQRFKDAGLNPNLIYGQGTAGNASSAPQMVTPEVSKIDEHMARLGQLFNIEGLRKLRAERRESESNAELSRLQAFQAAEQQEAREVMGYNYRYNTSTGRFELDPDHINQQRGIRRSPAVNYYINRELLNDYNKNALIPYRAGLLNYQQQYLAPQVYMQRYNAKNYRSAYWIGQGRQIIGGFNDIIGNFMPSKWLLPYKPGSFYKAPWSGNIY